MKQDKQMYEAPKVELIEMQAQGVLCSSVTQFDGKGFEFDTNNGAWTMP